MVLGFRLSGFLGFWCLGLRVSGFRVSVFPIVSIVFPFLFNFLELVILEGNPKRATMDTTGRVRRGFRVVGVLRVLGFRVWGVRALGFRV